MSQLIIECIESLVKPYFKWKERKDLLLPSLPSSERKQCASNPWNIAQNYQQCRQHPTRNKTLQNKTSQNSFQEKWIIL